MSFAFLGTNIINKDGEKVSHDHFKTKKTIGLYFSAHWCNPCRNFTPKLKNFYEQYKDLKDVEIVFVSCDRDNASFKKYYDEMPWLAIDYSDQDILAKIMQDHDVKGIPALVFYDQNGELYEKDGVRLVSTDFQGAFLK